jgi:hypothetical protein
MVRRSLLTMTLLIILVLLPAGEALGMGFMTITPTIQNGPAKVSGSTVTLTGSIDPNGLSTKYTFGYALASEVKEAYRLQEPGGLFCKSHTPIETLSASDSPQSVSSRITGLAPGEYIWDIFAANGQENFGQNGGCGEASEDRVFNNQSSSFTFTVAAVPATLSVVKNPSKDGKNVSLVLACTGMSSETCTTRVSLIAYGTNVGGISRSIAAGQRATLVVPLTSAGRRLRKSHKRLEVTIVVTSNGGHVISRRSVVV